MTDALYAIELQLRRLWVGRPPVVHPECSFSFKFSTDLRDRDNAQQTLIDCMVRAGILAEDNVRNFNGKVTLVSADVDPTLSEVDEIARVRLDWNGRAWL